MGQSWLRNRRGIRGGRWLPGILGAIVACFFSATASTHAQEDFISYPRGVYSLDNVRLLDGAGTPAAEGFRVIIEGERIVAVGLMKSLAAPGNASHIDLQGKTLMPGLIMMHEHLFYPTKTPKPASPPHQGPLIPRVLLASGVTTARTAGTVFPLQDLALAQAIDNEETVGADLVVTMPYVDQAPTYIFGIRELETPEQASQLVDYWAGAGADSVKGFMNASTGVLKAAIDTAHKQGIKVTGHLCAVTFAEAAAMGIDNLEHGFSSMTDFVEGKEKDKCPRTWREMPSPEDPRVQELFSLLIEKDVVITLTPAVTERSMVDAAPLTKLSLDLMSENAREVHDHYQNMIDDLEPEKVDRYLERRRKDWQLTLAFARAGGRLMVGSDVTPIGGSIPGPASHRALELLVDMGFSPREAIHMATAEPANYLGRHGEIGTIKPGARADFIVIQGKPDRDISAIRNIETVFKRGVGYDPERLIASARNQIGS